MVYRKLEKIVDICDIVKNVGQGVSGLYIVGRVVGIIEENGGGGDLEQKRGFYVQDFSGRVFVVCEKLPRVGDIVQIAVAGGEKDFVFGVGEALTVTPCEDDFFISKDSPNWKKIVIDWNLREKLLMRVKIIKMIREFFDSKGFIETDTPELVKLPGMEPYLDVFKTKFVPLKSAQQDLMGSEQEMYLITSPEYAMKKLLVGGFEKIYQITKAFRNKETGGDMHNPEFTILEWYRAFADYKAIMNDAQEMITGIFEKLWPGQREVEFNGGRADLIGSWRRLRVVEAFEEYAGISTEIFEDEEVFRAVVFAKGYNIKDSTGADLAFDDLFFLVFLNEIEPKLGFGAPVFLYDYPVSMAALSKRCEGNPKYAERVELYICGVELMNGFTELNDPVEQEMRLRAEREERIKLGKDVYDVDMSFIEALKFGMPPSAGPALGVDRLVMLLTGSKSIKDVLFFPHKDL